MWDIRKTREELEDEVCRTIIIVHAILECDTTSTVFGRGKAVYLKKVMKSPHFFQLFKKRVYYQVNEWKGNSLDLDP